MATHVFAPLENPSPTNDNAVAISALFASSGLGTTVLLLALCVYPIYSPICLGESNHLATQNYPTFESGNQAVVDARGDPTAIRMFNVSKSSIKNVHVKVIRLQIWDFQFIIY